MTPPSLVWGSPSWLAVALGLLAVATPAILWSYGRARAKPGVAVGAALLKALAFTLLALILLEPLLTGTRPRRGANAFIVLADNSQSLQVRDGASSRTRGEWVREALNNDPAWRTRLAQDFDVRSYVFDSHLRAVQGFEELNFDGTGTALNSSLASIARRFRGMPVAGVLLFTDGNRTDAAELDLSQLPPVYPIVPPGRGAVRDVGVTQVSVSQTNFESAPAVIRADVAAAGYAGETVVAAVVDEAGKEVARQEAKAEEGRPLSFRFQFRPEHKGVSFYRVQVFPATDARGGRAPADLAASTEQTLANNSRLAVVDQGGGPYRVLYVGGRPNWEFKFLRRAESEDEQVHLVGLVRIARRQPKFDFRAAGSRSTSPLFKGFDNPDADTAETPDQPVLVRFGTLDESELRDGFPKTAEELYRYHAVILDDVEATFFTGDQLALLRNFVSQRGGGLLMLGGTESFADGRYDKTAVGELLPVYLNRSGAEAQEGDHRLVLSREGWLQPWVRLRKTEEQERERLAEMPPFQTLSQVGEVKPGASVLVEASDASGQTVPVLVAQQFGKGHVAALTVGDLWKWGMHRKEPAESDLEKAWRQTVRWLVGDVPARVDVAVRAKSDGAAPAVEVTARVRDAEYRPLDNARVALKLNLPGGESLNLEAAPDAREAGLYAATYVPRAAGAYKVVATASAPDGSAVGEAEAGWAAQPAADEFARLEPDRAYLDDLAAKTRGEVVDGGSLGRFISSLATRDAPVIEPWTAPLWHHPLYLLAAIACLTGEWLLRRVNGLA
jgi:uncharacterized membrane protein